MVDNLFCPPLFGKNMLEDPQFENETIKEGGNYIYENKLGA